MTLTIEELNLHQAQTFSYKGRRWFLGAYLPWKQEYEIHTIHGDRCTTVPGDTIVTKAGNRW